MSFSLIKILEDLRTTHGKKAMYVHFSEEKTPVKRQRPSILTVQRMTRPREFCWKCQSLAYQLSHYLLHVSVRNYICTLTYIRWVFWDDPLAVWVMVHTLLLIDGVVKDNPQVTEMFCLSVWRACLQKNMFGGDRSSPRHESGALCIPSDGVTLSTYSYSVHWMKELYLHKDEFPIKFITPSYISDFYPQPRPLCFSTYFCW